MKSLPSILSLTLCLIPLIAQAEDCPPGYEKGDLGSLNRRSESIGVGILSPVPFHPSGYMIGLQVSYIKRGYLGNTPENSAHIDVLWYDPGNDRKHAQELTLRLADEFSNRRVENLCVQSMDPEKPHPKRTFKIRYGMKLDARINDPGSSF